MNEARDGLQDGFVSDSIFRLVGPKMCAFSEKLLATESPRSLKDLLRKITPPKGVKGKNAAKKGEIPEDEGTELLDCEEDELPPDDIADLETDEDEVMDIDTAVETEMGNTSETIDMNLAENTDPDQSESPSLSILSQLTDDPEFLNDARFLDDFQKLLDKYEGTTSIRFRPDMLRFKQLNSKARQNFKKQYR